MLNIRLKLMAKIFHIQSENPEKRKKGENVINFRKVYEEK